MEQTFAPEPISILHELRLGQHLLLLHSDNSMDLLAITAPPSDGAVHGVHLCSEEAYRLYASLHTQFTLDMNNP